MNDPSSPFLLPLVALLSIASAPNADAAGGSVVQCDPCIDRTSVRLGVVDHGIRGNDPFWDSMDAAIRRGAKDANITLTHSSTTENVVGMNSSAIFERMVDEIVELCGGGGGGGGGGDAIVDGILVTLPDQTILDALEHCTTAGVRIATFNAGIDLAKSGGHQYFGQSEYDAGYEAGSALASINGTQKFCFVNHAPGIIALTKRWEGMNSGIADTVETYRILEAVVDLGNCTSWKETVHDMCRNGDSGNWSTVGLYVGGEPNHECAIEFLNEYPETYAAFSDVSEYMYDGMRDGGLNILFGIDQQAYLQGYLPFSFLTLAVTNGQLVGNDVIETGPHLVTVPPDASAGACAAAGYAVCGDEEEDEEEGAATAVSLGGDGETAETDSPPPPPPTPPASRSLMKQSTDGLHQVVLAVGGLAMAIVGGYVLAN
jgi:ABC-type sugar transport system substrate-binding protein